MTLLREQVPGLDKVILSAHCHNDLGMAVANTLAAVRAGATQIECTINGIGERAGNAALEEVVMALHTRKSLFNRTCRIDTTQLYRTCKLVSALIGRPIPAHKAVVGANAFAHEAGIHQHGVLSETTTYEIMTPQSVGLAENKLVLGKHSGRHAFESRIGKMGYRLTEDELNRSFDRFKDLADRKKTITELDIEAILQDGRMDAPPIYRLERFIINSGNTITATANVRLVRNGKSREKVAVGDGPMDAAFKAVEKIIGTSFQLEDYSVHSVGAGKDAQGEVVVKIRKNGRLATGHGLSTDVVEAGILAYINAANRMLGGLCPPAESEAVL
jgi:2-isopropylmalate synthase